LDSNIEHVKSVISRVIRDSGNINNMLSSHRHLISWVRFIPPEVWANIFIFCMDDEPYIRWSITPAPFVFQLVCSTWRNTVLTTPQLW
ncbi:hypothetical protein C8J56DRAFT_748863, partial [Mycena floridula]